MISIWDNCYSGVLKSMEEMSDLLPLGNKPLKVLCTEHENLLVFPPDLSETEDRLGEDPIFEFEYGDEQHWIITTKNVMGFVGRKNQKLRIYSRFDTKEHDFFLHYMIQKVLSINLFELNHSSNDVDVFDLLIFLFPHYLKNAIQQGLYREYTWYEYNDLKVKGVIDIQRHIRQNIPFNGKMAYKTREYSCDNSMTQLIRHTIEYINTRKMGSAILEMDMDTKQAVKEFIECTPSYNKGKRQEVISKNMRLGSHPYYTEYIPLRDLCLRILRLDEIKYGESDDEMTGILFDGAWLWEEYCNTILRDYDFIHPENKKWNNPKYLFTNHTCPRFPDFYSGKMVIDAKYKKYGDKMSVSGAGGDDLHQIVTYMYMLKVTKGAFLSPFQTEKPDFVSATLNGYGGEVSLFGIEIPLGCENYSDFCELMKMNEEKFKQKLEEALTAVAL